MAFRANGLQRIKTTMATHLLVPAATLAKLHHHLTNHLANKHQFSISNSHKVPNTPVLPTQLSRNQRNTQALADLRAIVELRNTVRAVRPVVQHMHTVKELHQVIVLTSSKGSSPLVQ